MVKSPPANAGDAGDMGLIHCPEDSLEEEMTALSSIPAWEILLGKRSWLQYMGFQKVVQTEHTGKYSLVKLLSISLPFMCKYLQSQIHLFYGSATQVKY